MRAVPIWAGEYPSAAALLADQLATVGNVEKNGVVRQIEPVKFDPRPMKTIRAATFDPDALHAEPLTIGNAWHPAGIWPVRHQYKFLSPQAAKILLENPTDANQTLI
jgi:hypothetical protein